MKKSYCIYIIIFIFFILSLLNLGNFNNFPTTGISLEQDEEILIELKEKVKENNIFYVGIYSAEVFGTPEIYYSIDNTDKSNINKVKDKINFKKIDTKPRQFLGNFYLAEFKEEHINTNYIKLSTRNNNWNINEITIFSVKTDNDDKIIETNIYKEGYDYNLNLDKENTVLLSDEQTYIFRENNNIYRLNLKGMYNYTGFDEMIYKLTPNEIIKQSTFYENTHPPLGKFITTIGVFIFGYNFFGIRIMSVVFNVLLLFLIYKFIYKITKDIELSNLGTILFGCEFLRYTIGRLCTIGNFDIFFILLSFYFMYDFYKNNSSFFNIKDYISLLFSGISIGFAIACKWTGFYACIGLCIIFFIAYIKRIIYMKKINIEIIFSCFLFFVLIPIMIYSLSYILFYDGTDFNFIIRMLTNQEFILKHHTIYATIEEGVSKAYLWPFDIGAMTSLSATFDNKNYALYIILWGNPLIVLLTIPMIIFSFYNIIKYKDSTNLFLLISGLSVYIPWLLIKRPLYIYHYYLFIPFLILLIIYNIKNIKFLKIYVGINIAIFAFFFPILNGIYMPLSYFELLKKISFFI